MKPWINYHHLFYFMTIAEAGSISAAAEKLLLGQPTLSAQLKQFEDSIGVQLFERKHKKLYLTEHGQLALDYAKNIFKMGSEMYEALKDNLKSSKVNVQIGALDSIGKQVMLQLTQAAQRATPCTMTLVEGRFEELIRELKAHRVDLVISDLYPRIEATKGLHYKVLSKGSIGIYGGQKFKSLQNNFPRSLIGQPFILPTHDSKLRFDFEHWLKVQDLSVDIIAETQDTALKKLMAVSDMALIPAPSYSIQKELESGELFKIGDLDIFEEIYLISAQRKIENPVASYLMKEFHL